jgi:peptide/nickel transport system ATP-binding protein
MSRPPDPTTAPILECRDVGRSFTIGGSLLSPKKTLAAVKNVNLRVERGQTLAVVGESGSGKTTLAKMILGLLPPSHGEILLYGKPVSDIDSRSVARMVQPVFQDPYSSLNPRKTIQAIIEFPLRVHRMGDRRTRRERVAEIMRLVGLPERLIHSYPNQLSGGQRQRVAIARALAIEPGIMVCDEPTSALDVSVQAHILNLLLELGAKFNLTYVLISHNLTVVQHLADWVAVMYLGRIVEFAPAEELFQNPKHPYTQALLDSALPPIPRRSLPKVALGRSVPNPLAPPPGCTFHPRCPRRTELCVREEPATRDVGEHKVACHLYAGAPLPKFVIHRSTL